jgi:excisionase family DNA binding protein
MVQKRSKMSKEEIIGKILQADPSQLKRIEGVFNNEPEPQAKATPTDRRLLTFTDAAQTLGLSRMTIQRMVEDGRLQAIETRSGRQRIASAEITRFLEGSK